MNHIANAAPLYEADEHAWIAQQVAALRGGRLEELDREHLAEYLTDMTIRDRRELKSHFVVLLSHLLKLRFQPERFGASWARTIGREQEQITDIFELVPSLAAQREAFLEMAYRRAVAHAASETRLPKSVFPARSPWTADEALSFVVPEPPARPWRRKR